MGRIQNILINFFTSPLNIYGLLLLLVFVISKSLLSVLPFSSFLIVLLCIIILNFVFYLLGAKSSAMFYFQNMDILKNMMKEIDNNISRNEADIVKKLMKKTKKEYYDEDDDDDITKYN